MRKRSLLILGTAIMLSCGVVGCGSESKPTPKAVEKQAEETTKSVEEVNEKVEEEQVVQEEQLTNEEVNSTAKEEQVSTEYKNALKSAQGYSDMMHMSKAEIYDQLTSEYGGRFPADAAQYAVDNVEADFKHNALESAKTYYEMMSMSKQAIYDQLISEYGDKFTAEEAQYAIDNLQ